MSHRDAKSGRLVLLQRQRRLSPGADASYAEEPRLASRKQVRHAWLDSVLGRPPASIRSRDCRAVTSTQLQVTGRCWAALRPFSACRVLDIVNKHRSGTPGYLRANPWIQFVNLAENRGPDRRRSGPHPERISSCYIKVLQSSELGARFGAYSQLVVLHDVRPFGTAGAFRRPPF
jgi:hypothetical protein